MLGSSQADLQNVLCHAAAKRKMDWQTFATFNVICSTLFRCGRYRRSLPLADLYLTSSFCKISLGPQIAETVCSLTGLYRSLPIVEPVRRHGFLVAVRVRSLKTETAEALGEHPYCSTPAHDKEQTTPTGPW